MTIGVVNLNTLAAWFTLLAYLAFAGAPCRNALTRLSNRLGDLTVGLLLLPYLLAVGLQPAAADLVRFVIFLALPTLLLRLSVQGRRVRPVGFFQLLAILAIWVPVEMDLFLLVVDLIVPSADLGSLLSGFYLLPEVKASLLPGIALPIHTLTAVLLSLFLFLVHHPLEGVGFTLRLGWGDLRDALAGLVAFAVVGLPLGWWMGFLRYNPAIPGLSEMLARVVGGYLLVALVEEVLFRGVIQNLLGRRPKSNRTGLFIASIIFGLAHLNNATAGFRVPNMAYVVMSTLAGLAYGWVWMRTRKVTASAITHMLVNLIWVTVFH